MTDRPPASLQRTPLHQLHLELGARMVPFAGYEMPVQYRDGIIAEHRHCRSHAALFDVSHMGQLRLVGADAAAALETLVPMDLIGLGVGRQRYALLTNAAGGIIDDLMVSRPEPGSGFGDLLLVVNASRKQADTAHLITHIGHRCHVQPLDDRALLALQGPHAVDVLARLDAKVAGLTFMSGGVFRLHGSDCFVTRSGYTGEDGFEISVAADRAPDLARQLLASSEVKPAGLGARDTLRLEAGLCLYGHDIGETTTPVEAGLTWAIQKVRRAGGERAGGYPGAAAIDAQFATGPTNRRVGLVGLERVPVREGCKLVDSQGHALGVVTSGTLAPTIDRPIAMAYLPANHAQPHAEVHAVVRGKTVPMQIAAMPFVAHRYFRG